MGLGNRKIEKIIGEDDIHRHVKEETQNVASYTEILQRESESTFS